MYWITSPHPQNYVPQKSDKWGRIQNALTLTRGQLILTGSQQLNPLILTTQAGITNPWSMDSYDPKKNVQALGATRLQSQKIRIRSI